MMMTPPSRRHFVEQQRRAIMALEAARKAKAKRVKAAEIRKAKAKRVEANLKAKAKRALRMAALKARREEEIKVLRRRKAAREAAKRKKARLERLKARLKRFLPKKKTKLSIQARPRVNCIKWRPVSTSPKRRTVWGGKQHKQVAISK